MSQDQLDALTRRLATSTSRRQMLKALAGGALAAAAGVSTVLRFGSAEAAGHKCCHYCCSKHSAFATYCVSGADCPNTIDGCLFNGTVFPADNCGQCRR
jgi:hypothetical protein